MTIYGFISLLSHSRLTLLTLMYHLYIIFFSNFSKNKNQPPPPNFTHIPLYTHGYLFKLTGVRKCQVNYALPRKLPAKVGGCAIMGSDFVAFIMVSVGGCSQMARFL